MVNAKNGKGSATLSMAYAGARLVVPQPLLPSCLQLSQGWARQSWPGWPALPPQSALMQPGGLLSFSSSSVRSRPLRIPKVMSDVEPDCKYFTSKARQPMRILLQVLVRTNLTLKVTFGKTGVEKAPPVSA